MKYFGKSLNMVHFLLWFLLLFQKVQSIDHELMTSLLNGVSIRKCSCNANEYFTDGVCHTKNTTIPLIISTEYVEPVWEPTSIFQNIKVEKLDCPVETTLVRVEPRDLFILAFSGSLYHVPTNHTLGIEDYCIEHITNNTGSVMWEVQLCLQSPSIQVCCPNQGKDEKCEPPPLQIWYGYSLLKNIEVDFVDQTVECAEGKVTRSVQLSTPFSLSYLSYESASALVIDFSRASGVSYYPADAYCINPKTGGGEDLLQASFCIPDPLITHQTTCEGKACVRKCCPEGMLYSDGEQEQSCIPYAPNMLWQPKFKTLNGSIDPDPKNKQIITGFPICKRHFYSLDPSKDKEKLVLLSSGELFTSSTGKITSWRYCLENFLDQANHIQETALICFPEDVEEKSLCYRIKENLYPIFLVLSCIFLAVTLVVYAIIPELHAKLHGKSLLSHVTALMAAYLLLAIIQWGSSGLSMALCRSFAFALQISFLAAFFWLNVMCFDIWWALRSMRPVAETSSTSRRRFVYYSIYAWGCPVIIGTVTLAMELLPHEGQNAKDLILPGFGRTKCWFEDNRSLWAYFYSFLCILTISNIIFFVFVAMILLKAQRTQDDILKFTRQQHKERVWIYLKLFLVMGITWLCEILSWREGSCEYWFFTDVINALQGFFIFLIFICKKNVWEKLKVKCKSQKKRKIGTSATDGSSSRSTLQSTLESSTRKLSSLQYHLSRFQRETIKEEPKQTPNN